MQRFALVMLIAVGLMTTGCAKGASPDAATAPGKTSAASVRPSSESSTQVLVGLATTLGADVAQEIPMSFADDATYQQGTDAPMKLSEAVAILPAGKTGDHGRVVWWGNPLARVTYHETDGTYVVDKVWASVPR